ncbi:MAG: TrgA family protein [Rubellimicrobium sp.]|nr:TrgA family protein [Rubellimicrobium sp.]
MPTAGKLTAAFLFAALFGAVAQLALPAFAAAEQPEPRAFALVNMALGLVIGWRLGGARAGSNTWAGAVGQGITTTVAITFAALVLHGGIRMVALSMRKAYDGPAEAVIAVFGLMIDIGRTAALPEVIAALAAGAVVIGLVVEWIGRRAD